MVSKFKNTKRKFELDSKKGNNYKKIDMIESNI